MGSTMTPEQNAGLIRLLFQWPEGRAVISPQCVECPLFGEVCAAYDEACVAAEFWQQQVDAGAFARTAEYQCLAHELKLEAQVFARAISRQKLLDA